MKKIVFAIIIMCLVGCGQMGDVSTKDVGSGTNSNIKEVIDSIELNDSRSSVVNKLGEPDETVNSNTQNINTFFTDIYNIEELDASYAFVYDQNKLIDKQIVTR